MSDLRRRDNLDRGLGHGEGERELPTGDRGVPGIHTLIAFMEE
jgi:hypothetical protein